MPDSFQVLNEIKKYYRGEPLSLIYIHNRLREDLKITKPKIIGNFLRILHISGKIEFVGARIKPVGNNRRFYKHKDSDIIDALLDFREMNKMPHPDEARRHFEDKHDVWVNAETWTRDMRRMRSEEPPKINSTSDDRYYLKKDFIQKRLTA